MVFAFAGDSTTTILVMRFQTRAENLQKTRTLQTTKPRL